MELNNNLPQKENNPYTKSNWTNKATQSTILPSTLGISGSKYVDTYHFSCGNDVPIYEVHTVHALNQLIGHAKFNNQS